jgi:phage terminase small subunit
MPLSNPRWERFCQAYVRGETAGNATASYLAAGFRIEPEWASSNAFKVMQIPAVRARIAQLQMDVQYIETTAVQTAAERLALQKEAVLRELSKVGFARIADYVRRTPEGEWVIDFEALERDRGAGIVEFQMTETTEGDKRKRHVKIKMGGKVVALGMLGKHLGLFVERKEQDHESLRHVSTEELARELADYARTLGLGGGADAPSAPVEGGGADAPPEPDQA